jgi:hypothetical protein
LKELKSCHLFTITMKLAPTLELGETPAGKRRMFTVSIGQFVGERLRGEVLPEAGSDLLGKSCERTSPACPAKDQRKPACLAMDHGLRLRDRQHASRGILVLLFVSERTGLSNRSGAGKSVQEQP